MLTRGPGCTGAGAPPTATAQQGPLRTGIDLSMNLGPFLEPNLKIHKSAPLQSRKPPKSAASAMAQHQAPTVHSNAGR